MLKNHLSNLFLLRLFMHSMVSYAHSPSIHGNPIFNQSSLLKDVKVKFLSESFCSIHQVTSGFGVLKTGIELIFHHVSRF